MVCVGTLMTLVVQSSSATIAVLQNFASQAGPDGVISIIGLAGAIPILLGDNIGTTITALLASVGQSKDAKRTAAAHCIFNLSGAFLFIWIIKPYAYLIQTISPKGNEVDVISRQIANAHTGFNLTMTLIWIPLIALMVKLVMKIVLDKKENLQALPSAPKYLDDRLINQPAAALHLVAKEVIRCSDLVREMLEGAKNGNAKDYVDVKDIVEKAQIENELNESITEYLSAMYSEGVLTEEQAEQSTGIMYVLCDIDRMASLCREIAENVMNQSGKKAKYSKEALKEVKKSVNVILEMYEEAMHAIITGEDIPVENIQSTKEEVLLLVENMRKSHAQRVAKKKCDAKLTVAYNNIFHDIARMGNSCVNLIDIALNHLTFQVFLADED